MSAVDFLFALVRRSLEASLLILLVLAVQWVFHRRLSPQWSSALWLLVAARLLLPVSVPSSVSVFNFVPRLWERNADAIQSPTVSTPAPTGAVPATNGQGVERSDVPVQAGPASAAATQMSATRALGAATPRRDWRAWAVRGWLAGAALFAAYVAVGTWTLGRRFGGLRCVDDPALLGLLAGCCARMGVRRLPAMWQGAAVTAPALQGVFHPRLLLPEGFAEEFSEEEQRFVLLHELAHLRRRDLALNWLTAALQAVYWFNPLVWYAFARWRADREIACDAMAIGAADPTQHLAYGRTLLKLLERAPVLAPQPNLAAVVESPRALRRRVKMIAGYAPARGPLLAATLAAALAVIGFTEAQIIPAPAFGPVAAPTPLMGLQLKGNSVVFLVQASESMLGDTREQRDAVRFAPDEEKRATPKWRRVAQTVQSLANSLTPGTTFRVVLFADEVLLDLPPVVRGTGNDSHEIVAAVKAMLAVTPRGQPNLAEASLAVGSPIPIDHVVLVTDGMLWGRALLIAPASIVPRTEFHEALLYLPSRASVHTVLLPGGYDYDAVGVLWELAHRTRGSLLVPPHAWPAADVPKYERLALVIDTSGSMRDPVTGGLWPVVVRKVDEILEKQVADTGFFKLYDADGRPIVAEGQSDEWLANTPAVRAKLAPILRRYEKDNLSNPVPGIYQAVRNFGDLPAAGGRAGIFLLGDEFVEDELKVLQRLDEINPRGADGRRRIDISAIGFPTTIRTAAAVGSTGLKFASLARSIAQEHDGMFVALKDL